MKEIGCYEAKTRLPALLRDVETGETVVITRHGKPIAKLVPASSKNSEKIAAAIARIVAARRGRPTMSVEEILSARDEGRKY
jgi:prevent-host-death family protein